MTNTLKLVTLRGVEITPYVTSIAKLEMEIFSEYPYLYEIELSGQINYVKRFAECEQGIVVLAMEADNIAGLSTGIPLLFDTEPFKKPFIDNCINIERVFYLGETLLLPEYRGKGIYRHLFAKREAMALEHGYSICAFISVERSPDDPRQPVNYMPLDAVWQHFGYKKHPELSLEFEWRDVGENNSSKKKLVYWIKEL